MTHLVLKYLHILAASLWIGSLSALIAQNAWLACKAPGVGRPAMFRLGMFIDACVLGPAAALTLLTGIGLALLSDAGFTHWMMWGLVMMVAAGALGAAPQAHALRQLGDPDLQAARGAAQATTLLRRVTASHTTQLALLLSAARAMVFKPAL